MRPLKSKQKRSFRHIGTIMAVLVLCCAVTLGNIFYVMVFKKHLWSQQSVLNRQIETSLVRSETEGKRGTIYDKNGTALAQETEAWTLLGFVEQRSEKETSEITYYDPADYIQDIDSFTASIKEVLGSSVNEKRIKQLYEQAKEKGYDQFELGAGTKRIDTDTKEELEKRKIPGLGFMEAYQRNYPNSPFSSNLIGYATYNDDTGKIRGVLGLENSMESYLAGENGVIQYQQTSTHDVIPGTNMTVEPAVDGYDVHLTLDSNLQSVIEENMEETMKVNKAEKAWVLVMEVETGKILGWASYPTFDQNKAEDIPSFTDNVSEMAYECGSVIKPLTFATAIDTGVFPYDTKYRAKNFNYTVDQATGKITRVSDDENTGYQPIKDALGADFGTITFEEGLGHSSNIAICELLANYVKQEDFQKYMKNFGLFVPTGIPYVSETTGTAHNDNPTDYLSSGFGQASSLTVLQLCQAYTAIFNDGVMMEPYIVESITNPADGSTVQSFQPTIKGTPISADTAAQVRDMMYLVLEPGYSGANFKMDGIDMIAKTGTGQIYDPDTGTYATDKYTDSIMAAVPGDDPKVMVYYGLVAPSFSYSTGNFQNIMEAALVSANVQTKNNHSMAQSFVMPGIINHTLSYAQKQLNNREMQTVFLGDGNAIINQYPEEGESVGSSDVALILTNGEKLEMPDMTGWTRKDIQAFEKLTGVPVEIKGYNRVESQEPEAGEEIKGDTHVKVVLSEEKLPNQEDEQQSQEGEESGEETWTGEEQSQNVSANTGENTEQTAPLLGDSASGTQSSDQNAENNSNSQQPGETAEQESAAEPNSNAAAGVPTTENFSQSSKKDSNTSNNGIISTPLLNSG